MKLHGWLWVIFRTLPHQLIPTACAQLIPRESDQHDQRLVGSGFVSEAPAWYMMFWMAVIWTMVC